MAFLITGWSLLVGVVLFLSISFVSRVSIKLDKRLTFNPFGAERTPVSVCVCVGVGGCADACDLRPIGKAGCGSSMLT